MPDRARRLAARLLDGVAHLRAGRLADCIRDLEAVCADPELAAAADLRDVRCRALTLLGDALLRSDRLDEAEAAAREAGSLARAMEDRAAVAATRDLWGRIADARRVRADEARRAAAARVLLDTPDEVLRARYGADPRRLADILVRKASAAVDGAAPEVARSLAAEALDRAVSAGAVREEVFARLVLARATPDAAREHVLAALSRADAAGEPTLLSTVARTADLLGVPLPVQSGPIVGRG